jgi:hypothetical protein
MAKWVRNVKLAETRRARRDCHRIINNTVDNAAQILIQNRAETRAIAEREFMEDRFAAWPG